MSFGDDNLQPIMILGPGGPGMTAPGLMPIGTLAPPGAVMPAMPGWIVGLLTLATVGVGIAFLTGHARLSGYRRRKRR